MKFRNPSMYGSEVSYASKSVTDARTDEGMHPRTHGRTTQKLYAPSIGKILIRKQYVSYFMRNPHMQFQNPSMHGSEVMLCIKKRNGRADGRTNAPTHARTNDQEANEK